MDVDIDGQAERLCVCDDGFDLVEIGLIERAPGCRLKLLPEQVQPHYVQAFGRVIFEIVQPRHFDGRVELGKLRVRVVGAVEVHAEIFERSRRSRMEHR